MRIIKKFAVEKSPKEVFDYVAVNYFENHQKFDPEIYGMINHTTGPVAKNTKGAEVRKFAGKRIKLDFEVTDFEPVQFFAFRNTSGPFYLERSYSFKPNRKGTEVVFIFDIRPKNLLVKPIFPLMAKTFRKSVSDNIQNLNNLLNQPN
jgi:hypothetical protein